MSKKPFVLPDDTPAGLAFDPNIGAAKMPTNISGGQRALSNFRELPTFKLIPYRDKKDSDFSSLSPAEMKSLQDSIEQDGILEPLIVRHAFDDMYEIISGERRWIAAKNINLVSVPCRILDRNIDDDTVERIFAITNLARRTLTMQDLVNGWWHYHEATKRLPGRKKVEEVLAEDVELVGEGTVGKISIRQMQKYHKVHGLNPTLLQRLYSGNITFNIAYTLSFLKSNEQEDVAKQNLSIDQKIADAMKRISEDGEWSDGTVKALYFNPNDNPKAVRREHIARFVRHARRTLPQKFNPECYGQLSDIVDEAIEQYLDNHPEYRA